MEELPTPLSRVELYLAKAAGMDVTPPEPKSRLELFLAKIAGMDVEMPAPLSLKEMWLAHVAGSAPIEPLAIEGAFYIDNQKVDVRYLAVAAGVIGATLPEKPQNRKEQYWLAIASGGPIVGVLKYVTGTNITLTDVVSGIEELQFVYGDTYQQTYSGKNILNGFTNQTSGGIISTWSANVVTLSGKSTSTYSNITGTDQIALEAGQTYTLSTATPTDLFRIQFRIRYSGNNYQYTIGKNETSTSFTIPDDATSPVIRVLYIDGFTSGTDIEGVFKLQLELGSQPTSYEPYTGGIPAPSPSYPQPINVVTGTQIISITDGTNTQNFTVNLGATELCKIGTYQDYIYQSNGDWYVHKDIGKVVLDGGASETITVHRNPNPILGVGIEFGTVVKPGTEVISYYFRYVPFAQYFNDNTRSYGTISSHNDTGLPKLYLSAPDNTVTTAAQFQTWISSHNSDTYYVLATATDTKITDATLVGQLNAIDSAVLPKPVAYITVGATDPNLPAPIKISYYGESE